MSAHPVPPEAPELVGTLVLCGLLRRGERAHDLEVEVQVAAGRPAEDVTLHARTWNAPVHRGRLRVQPVAGGWSGRLEATLAPDQWAGGGGALAVDLEVRLESGRLSGTAQGTFAGEPVRATIGGELHAPVAFSVAPAAGRPRILQRFLAEGVRSGLWDWSGVGVSAGGAPPAMDGPAFRVEDYGARPDSGADALPAIQAAVDAASAAGGGVVLLPPGRLDLHPPGSRWQGCITVRHSGVVLRGAGAGPGGTELFSQRRGWAVDPKKPWLANEWPRHVHVGPASTTAVASGLPEPAVCALLPAERGAVQVTAAGPHDIRPGEVLLLVQREDADGTLVRTLAAPATTFGANWRGEGKAFVRHLVRVTAVDGPRLTLSLPLHADLRPQWRPELRRTPLLTGVGIEGIRFATAWSGYFDHHHSDEHDNGWDAVRCDHLADGWLRDCVFDSVTTAASFNNCHGVTAMDSRIRGNAGHNGFSMGGATSACLFLRLDGDRQMHALALQGTPAGNAMVDCCCSEPSGLDLHGSLALDTLIDALDGGVCHGGGSPSAVPPRHGHGFVLWNWRYGTFTPYQPWRRFDELADANEEPGVIAVGVHARDGRPLHLRLPDGRRVGFEGEADWGRVESLGRPVRPRSLWHWQRARGQGGPPASS